MTSLGGILFLKFSARIGQTCFRRSAHGIVGMSGIPVTGKTNKKPLPQIQSPSTWVLYCLSTESKKIQPPKPPVPAFILFTMEKRPHLMTTQPDASVLQIGKQLGQMWRELPEADKDRYKEIFRINMKKYKQEYDSFLANLSDAEKEQLQQDTAAKRKKMLALKTKRKLKSLNKPKKPMSAFLLYYESQMTNRGNTPITIFLKQVAQEWQVMPEIEKQPYLEKAKAEREKYEVELKAWEERMQAEGHPELVRGYKPPKVQKRKVRKLKKKALPKKKKVLKKKAAKKKVKAKKGTSKQSKSSTKKAAGSKKTKKASSAQTDESWMREE